MLAEKLTEQQLVADRLTGLGGSDTPVILRQSPFKTPYELWQEKRGLSDGPVLTPAMKRGLYLEPLVADMYSEITGRKLRRKNTLARSATHPCMIAHVDREIVSDLPQRPVGVLEIKCPGLRTFEKIKREGVPNYYQLQIQHYLHVLDRTYGSLCVFNAERWEMLHFDIYRDDDLIEFITAADELFWQQVQDNVPPLIDDIPAIDLPPLGGADLIRVETADWQAAIERLREANTLRKLAEEQEEEAQLQIKEMMGAHAIVEGFDARIYHTESAGRNSVDSARLKKELPDIYNKYLKVGKPYKTFRPYFLKQKNVE